MTKCLLGQRARVPQDPVRTPSKGPAPEEGQDPSSAEKEPEEVHDPVAERLQAVRT